MSVTNETVIKVQPFVVGAVAPGHAIVRLQHCPRYLGLTTPELALATELAGGKGLALAELLPRFLAGGDLDLKSGIGLVRKLHHAGFIENSSVDVEAQLAAFSANGVGGGRKLGRMTSVAAALIDVELLGFDGISIHETLAVFGRALISWPVLLALGLFAVGLGVYSGITFLPDQDGLSRELLHPEWLVAKLFFAFSAAASWTAFLQIAALAGAGAKFLGGGVRLTAFCVLRLATHDDDAHMLPRPAMLRYFALSLLSPWASALVFWQLAAQTHQSVFTVFAAAFSVIGIFSLCPLYRSPVVKLGEGILASPGLLASSDLFLRQGLFAGLAGARDGRASPYGEGARQWWLAGFASLSLAWLYFVSLTFTDAFLTAVPDLALTALDRRRPASALAAALLFLAMAIALSVPALKLLAIPLENLAVLAHLPLRRARKDLSSFYDKNLPPSAALAAFLRDIPIFAGIADADMGKLIASLKFRRFRAGQTVIKRGEEGREFFVMASGEAEVIVGGGDGRPGEVVDVLHAGDSFGEIALIEPVKRTATIRALSEIKTLVLERAVFDALFPAASDDRQRLTGLIRLVKLVLESEALSHLAPRQVRELLARSTLVTFADGEFLIHEHEAGDAAYLIASGEVQVVREEAAREVAVLGRGKLVGAISLIKDVTRTASCRAKGDVTALKIDKATFLGMCMSNMFVAFLVADLSDRQIAATRKAG